MAKLSSTDAGVALKSFLATVVVYSLVSFGCVCYHVINGISHLTIFGIFSIIWLVFTKFTNNDPYAFQVIYMIGITSFILIIGVIL